MEYNNLTLHIDATITLKATVFPPDAWYVEAVQYVYEDGMMNCTSKTTFSPDLVTTRGMIVTILYRPEDEQTITARLHLPTLQPISIMQTR